VRKKKATAGMTKAGPLKNKISIPASASSVRIAELLGLQVLHEEVK